MSRAAGVLLALGALLPAASPASGPPPVPSGTVVVVGIPGLRWDEVSEQGTPVLMRLARDSARGLLSVRSGHERTCPDAGWLSLGAGNRADGLSTDCTRRAGAADWNRLVVRNSGRLDGRMIGALGEALGTTCASADGHAVLAVGPATVTRRDGGPCPLRLIELPEVRDAESAGAADRALGVVLAATPAAATVIVAGISEVEDQPPHLHVVLIRGQGFAAGSRLSSPSTSRSPYVQLADLGPTALAVLGLEVPASMIGRPVHGVGGPGSLSRDVDRMADLDRRATAQRAAVAPFTVLLVLALVVLVAVALRGRRGRWQAEAAVVVMAMPLASFLIQPIPWWRAGALRLTALLVGCLVIAAAVTALALRWRRRRDPLLAAAIVAAATAGVIALDLMSGTHLQMDAVLGYSPYVAGRFVGLGNPGFAVFGTAAVLATALLVPRDRRAWRWVALCGAVAVAVDGAPQWGDDFGGVLALVPAFVVVGSLLSTGRVRWSRLVLAGAGATVLVSGFALADYARGSGHRTHLGRFVEQLRDGTAGVVIHRKAQANLDLLTHSPFTLLVPILLAAAIWLLLRPPPAVQRRLDTAPSGRAALLGVLALCIVGGLVNDSGTAIPAVALLLAVPVALVLGVSGRAAESAD